MQHAGTYDGVSRDDSTPPKGFIRLMIALYRRNEGCASKR